MASQVKSDHRFDIIARTLLSILSIPNACPQICRTPTCIRAAAAASTLSISLYLPQLSQSLSPQVSHSDEGFPMERRRRAPHFPAKAERNDASIVAPVAVAETGANATGKSHMPANANVGRGAGPGSQSVGKNSSLTEKDGTI